MVDSSRKHNKKSQINDYIRLGVVLKKERSPLKQQAVDSILRSRVSLKEKIEQIKHIDRAEERYGKPEFRKPESSAPLRNDKAAA
ncbi:MAG: hypothetical protein P8107_13005, partial [Spirochaetia bacterium]